MEELWNLDPAARAIAFLVGIALLTMGRRLFWLLVAVAGFVTGWWVAVRYLLDLALPPLAIAAVVGLAGAVLALFVQKLAVTLAGLVVGGLFGVWILPFLPLATSDWDVLVVLALAIAGALVARQVFATALTVLSSIAGALVLVETSGLAELPALFLFGALTAVGLIVQGERRGRRRRSLE